MTTQNTPTTQAKQAVADMAQQAKDTAGNVAKSTADTAKSQANAAKASVADEVSGIASALRTAAEEMRSGSPQERTFGQIAEGLADASDAMREKDLSTMVQDVSAFARKNPLVFLGGAALVGFAATRFAKASNQPTHDAGHDRTAYSPQTPYTSARGDLS